MKKTNAYSVQTNLLVILLASFTCAASAQDSNVEKSSSQLTQLRTLQQKASALAQTPSKPAYTIHKAKAWLDFAQDEYYDQDQTGIVQAAIDEAARLLETDANAENTPHPTQSEPVRQDLWDKVNNLKASPDRSCGDEKLAQLEVHLVWTGHEKWESGWQHAAPYAKQAENLAYEAQTAIEQCTNARLAATKPAGAEAAPQVIERTVTIEKYNLSTDALFAFDEYGVEHLVMGGKRKLDSLIAQLNTWKTLDKISLNGYTDRIGSETYNQTLSIKRAQAIADYLKMHGLNTQIETQGLGETNPMIECKQQRSQAALIECLQPNRRVEVLIEGTK